MKPTLNNLFIGTAMAILITTAYIIGIYRGAM